MRIAICKLQISDSAIYNLHFSICNLQWSFALSVCLIVAMTTGHSRAAEPALLPQELLDAGWISLFDGETLYGWQPVGEAKWEVVDGEVRTGGEQPGFLMTTTEWADFELHAEFKAAAKTNSGVFLRTSAAPERSGRRLLRIEHCAAG